MLVVFFQKASRYYHHLLLLASENKSFLYQPNYAIPHKLYMANSVDPDLKKLADLDSHCLQRNLNIGSER